MKKTYIITGASKGLGESLVRLLLKPGNQLICLSRSQNAALISEGEELGVPVSFYESNLSEPSSIEVVTGKIANQYDFSTSDKVVLINNAGMVDPIVRIGEAPADSLEKNIRLNLIGPMLITNWLIHTLSSFEGQTQIVNISSGAANNPYDGWAAYCSSKAGLDMFTKTVAEEQKRQSSPVEIISFSPGIMDTEMQGVIRGSEYKHFSNLEKFRGYKEKGQLRSTEFVAGRLLELLERGIENGRIYSINEFI